MIVCSHLHAKKYGRDRYGHQRFKCQLCGKMWAEAPAREPSPLGAMLLPVEDAKVVLKLLVEGSSVRSAVRVTGVSKQTILKLMVHFGEACKRFMDAKMRNLALSHLQLDEQWTFVAKKQARLTVEQKQTQYDQGDVFIWTAIDQKTKLLPCFLLGKRSANNARVFCMDIASRLKPFPKPHESDAHAYRPEGYTQVIQISTDAFKGYREAVDLAFGPFVKYGTIIKEYRNANIIYTPSEMVGTKRTGIRGIGDNQTHTICTSHVERLNGTQRLFLKRLNRLTYCFSKKLRNLEAAFAMFACYYNWCWQTRKPGKSGKLRATACMMAGIEGHVWSFDELFAAVLAV